MILPPTPLLEGEALQFDECERRIDAGLAAIRDGKLWRESFGSFEEYLAHWIEKATEKDIQK